MNPLLIATRNRGKQEEFRALLASTSWSLLFPDDLGIIETADEAGLERHDTFEANARAKAHWFAARSGLPTLADDSGLEVEALDGAPGVRSRRFAGVDGPDHDVTGANNTELLRCLAAIPGASRRARFRCVLVLVRPTTNGSIEEVVAAGATEGSIVVAPRGALGFGYDPLFLSDELGQTFGEVAPEVKASVSHRARAVAGLQDAISAS